MNTASIGNKNNNQDLKDFEILKDVKKGKIKIDELDIDTKVRLVSLCNNRCKEIGEKVKIKKEKNSKIERKIRLKKATNK